jgi:hypothetical protein
MWVLHQLGELGGLPLGQKTWTGPVWCGALALGWARPLDTTYLPDTWLTCTPSDQSYTSAEISF